MMTRRIGALALLGLLAACGPTAEEQAAMDRGRCSGFGYPPGSTAFADCMMTTTRDREAQQAADRRAAAARDAVDRDRQERERAARDAADRDAWDRRTGQGAYSSSPFGRSPTDDVRDAIERDRARMEGR